MVLDLDVNGIEKRIKKYRFGKYACLILFSIGFVYFTVLKVTQGYPINIQILFVTLLGSGTFWFTERNLIKTRKIMLETLDKLVEEQIKSAASAPNDAPLA